MTYPLQFRHNITDGWIYVDNGTGTQSIYPYAWWLTQEPAYTYPSGATYLQYITGDARLSYYVSSINQYSVTQSPLPTFPWTDGNTYISKQTAYDVAYAAYLAAQALPQTLSDAKIYQDGLVMNKYYSITNGGVIYDANTYYSDSKYAGMVFAETYLYTGIGSIPSGYSLTNEDDVQIVITLVDLQAINALIQKLYSLCRINVETHIHNISLLTTIPAVLAYDITTGWPTVPYNPIA